jgi:Arc/MetJ family transcription regulator
VNKTEATAVNVILRYLTGAPDTPTEQAAQDAAAALATRAHAALGAGFTAPAVRAAWPRHTTAPATE